jgi:hypothetical protein
VTLEKATDEQSQLLYQIIVDTVDNKTNEISATVPSDYVGLVNTTNIQRPTQNDLTTTPNNPITTTSTQSSINSACIKKISDQTIVAYALLIVFVMGRVSTLLN